MKLQLRIWCVFAYLLAGLPALAQTPTLSQRLETAFKAGWQIYDGKYNTSNNLFRCWVRRKVASTGKYEYQRAEAVTWDAAVTKIVDILAPLPPPPAPAPAVPGQALPEPDSQSVPLSATLSWAASGATSYQVRFGTANPPPVVSTTTIPSFSPSLAYSTTYYWQIVALNATGPTEGPIWKFTTAAAPPPPPDPTPVPPALPGPMKENLQRLRTLNHPWWAMILDKAKNAPYGDMGQWDLLAWIGTDEPQHARNAIDTIRTFWPRIPRDLGGNFVREYFVDLALWRIWLTPALTAEEKAAYDAMLKAWADYSIAKGEPAYSGGMPLADSDQMWGQYFGMALTDAICGTNYLNETSAGIGLPVVKVGGLTPTNEGTARDRIASYATIWAGGLAGTGPEYGEGENTLWIPAVWELARIHGKDYFPELTALIPSIRRYSEIDLVPDMSSQLKIGDVEHARSIRWIHKTQILAMLNSGLVPSIIERFGPTGWGSAEPYHRAFYAYDPAAPQPVDTSPVHWAGGMGVLIHRTPTALFAAHAATRIGIHHEVGYTADFRLWANGEWVIDHPIDYAGPATTLGPGNNTMLMAGLPSMHTRGPVAHGSGAGYSWVISETKGEYQPPGSYQPPPAFVNSWKRTTVYLEAEKSVIVRDSVDLAGDPKTMERFHNYSESERARMLEAPLQQWILHMPVQPTIAGSVISWTTAKGQTVQWTNLTGLVPQVIDENVLWADTWSMPESERKWQVRLSSNDLRRSWTNVVSVGAPIVTEIPGGVKVGGAAVTFDSSGRPVVSR